MRIKPYLVLAWQIAARVALVLLVIYWAGAAWWEDSDDFLGDITGEARTDARMDN